MWPLVQCCEKIVDLQILFCNCSVLSEELGLRLALCSIVRMGVTHMSRRARSGLIL